MRITQLNTAVGCARRACVTALQRIPQRGRVAAAVLFLLPLLGLSWHSLRPPPAAPAPLSPPVAAASAPVPAATNAPPRLHILYTDGDASLGPAPLEMQMLAQYSRSHHLQPVWIPVTDVDRLRQALLHGTGDVAVPPADAPLPGEPLTATLPWAMSREQVVGRDGSSHLDAPADLGLRQVAVRPASPAWAQLKSLLATHPAMALVPIPDSVSDRRILERVNTGRYDLAVLDSLTLQSYLPYYPDLKVQLDLGPRHARHWLVRPGSVTLLASLNRFLNKTHLELNLARVYREDLPKLQQRKLLRLITVRSPVNYFFDHGRLRGFDYDLMRRFAEQHGMRLDVVIADSQADMLALLRQGRGDVVGASEPAAALAGSPGIRTSSAYNQAVPVVVGRKHDRRLLDAADLAGRSVWLPEASPWFGVLSALQARGVNVDVHRAKGLDTEAVLFRVARGLYDLTVIGSQEVKAEFSRQVNLKAQFPLTGPQPLVWGVRSTDARLLSALNDYIGTEYRQGFYNLAYNRYIDDPTPLKASPDLLAGVKQLSPFDPIVRKLAEHYGFDWRLIVAQMYQESRFDPAAESDNGAEGLMQLLPATADEMGVEKRDDPAKSISGGIRYLDYLRSRFEEDDLPLEERTWFTLAAYNAGYNRVRQARQLAAKMHLNPDRWFDNVEKAMLKLSRPYRRDGETVRACRCGQTAVYVREIRTLYNNYVHLTQSVRTADKDAPAEGGDASAL